MKSAKSWTPERKARFSATMKAKREAKTHGESHSALPHKQKHNSRHVSKGNTKVNTKDAIGYLERAVELRSGDDDPSHLLTRLALGILKSK